MNEERTVSRSDWIAVISAALGAFMAVLDIQITNASLKDITGALGATLDEGSWVSLGYLLPEIVIIPLSGWLAQVFGLRRYLLWNVSLFLVFSSLCGLSWNLASMIAFRFGQGLTGGALIPLAFNIVLTKLPPAKQSIGFALFGVSATFAPAIGPTVGGWLTESFGWEWNFYINLIPGALMFWGLAQGLAKEPAKLQMLRGADWAGIGTMAVGLSSLTFFLEEGNRKDWFGSEEIRWAFALAVTCLPAFLIIEFWLAKRPFVDLRLYGKLNFGVGSLINFVLGAGLYGSIYLLPLYLQQLQGYSALQTGETLLWLGLPQLFLMPIAARLSSKFDPRILVAWGLCCFAGSCWLTSAMSADVAHDQLRFPLLLRAIGFPFIMVPITRLATAGIAPAQAGSASGLFNMGRNLGGSVGIAMLGTLLTNREHLHSNRIGEAVSLYSPLTTDRLAAYAQKFIAAGYDPTTADRMAIGAIDQAVRAQAYYLAYGDCFIVLAVALASCLLLLPACRRPEPVSGPEAAAAH